MNKILLSAGIETALFALNANAIKLNQYVSTKAAFVRMENDAYANSHYSYSSINHHYNKIWDNKQKDNF